MSPTAKKVLARSPAMGVSATAASSALSMCKPWLFSVAAQATTTKKPITPVSAAPRTTSVRS
jgi:hypothetical protein